MSRTEQNNRAELARRYHGKFSVRYTGEVYILTVSGWVYLGHIDNPKMMALH